MSFFPSSSSSPSRMQYHLTNGPHSPANGRSQHAETEIFPSHFLESNPNQVLPHIDILRASRDYHLRNVLPSINLTRILPNLKKLTLLNCDLTDGLLRQLCEQCNNVEYVDLSHNKIVNLPLRISHYWTFMIELNLSYNEIEVFSEVEKLNGLVRLKTLDLRENPVTFQYSYRVKLLSCLPQLFSLDGITIHRKAEGFFGTSGNELGNTITASREPSADNYSTANFSQYSAARNSLYPMARDAPTSPVRDLERSLYTKNNLFEATSEKTSEDRTAMLKSILKKSNEDSSSKFLFEQTNNHAPPVVSSTFNEHYNNIDNLHGAQPATSSYYPSSKVNDVSSPSHTKHKSDFGVSGPSSLLTRYQNNETLSFADEYQRFLKTNAASSVATRFSQDKLKNVRDFDRWEPPRNRSPPPRTWEPPSVVSRRPSEYNGASSPKSAYASNMDYLSSSTPNLTFGNKANQRPVSSERTNPFSKSATDNYSEPHRTTLPNKSEVEDIISNHNTYNNNNNNETSTIMYNNKNPLREQNLIVNPFRPRADTSASSLNNLLVQEARNTIQQREQEQVSKLIDEERNKLHELTRAKENTGATMNSRSFNINNNNNSHDFHQELLSRIEEAKTPKYNNNNISNEKILEEKLRQLNEAEVINRSMEEMKIIEDDAKLEALRVLKQTECPKKCPIGCEVFTHPPMFNANLFSSRSSIVDVLRALTERCERQAKFIVHTNKHLKLPKNEVIQNRSHVQVSTRNSSKATVNGATPIKSTPQQSRSSTKKSYINNNDSKEKTSEQRLQNWETRLNEEEKRFDDYSQYNKNSNLPSPDLRKIKYPRHQFGTTAPRHISSHGLY